MSVSDNIEDVSFCELSFCEILSFSFFRLLRLPFMGKELSAITKMKAHNSMNMTVLVLIYAGCKITKKTE